MKEKIPFIFSILGNNSIITNFEYLSNLIKKFPCKYENQISIEHVTPAAYSFYSAFIISYWKSKKISPFSIPVAWIICKNHISQESIHYEMSSWGINSIIFPRYYENKNKNIIIDPELESQRLQIIKSIQNKDQNEISTDLDHITIIICEESLNDPAPKLSEFSKNTNNFYLEQKVDVKKLKNTLIKEKYEQVPQVFHRGQFSIRGGIIDIFPWKSINPIRLELFDVEIESIREFDVNTQISINKLKKINLLFKEIQNNNSKVLNYIKNNHLVINIESEFLDANYFITESINEKRINSKKENFPFEAYDFPFGRFYSGDFVLQDNKRNIFINQLKEWENKKWNIFIIFNSKGEEKRFYKILGTNKNITPIYGNINNSFTIPDAKIAIISSSELFGKYQSKKVDKRNNSLHKKNNINHIQNFHDYEYGDYVVHIEYGIGKFLGTKYKNLPNDKKEEILEIQYANDSRLFVPIDQSHLISRYIGANIKKNPSLSSLNDNKWKKIKKSAEIAIFDYASEILSTQAQRESQIGFSHFPDNKWQWEFENSFRYVETKDQLQAIKETKYDMENERPMDRIICGDVGFGKTEVAIRAAFKSVMSEKQVAILAPTSVLSEQHYKNFKERMSSFPIKISSLNRYRSKNDQKKIISQIKTGEIDIVIGTHRILSNDIVFKDLGLVVIDEEQRFGVKHKEKFKKKWNLIDILTLSATPIPRTLHFSMIGMRQMSVINTPPINRKNISTIVCAYNEKIIKEAIEKELKRNGQVFFLHNRVKTIHKTQVLIQKLIPNAKIDVAHGQMESEKLEDAMNRFINHKVDILICTTIIESGVDIPNANTIIIERSDRFGLADLYQLRGRVGRSNRNAFAYLILPPDLLTTGEAKKRINSIKQYSSIGSGFKIAMRDLEIRGAGNLLGTKQSGHIASVGFELYCQLLKQSVNKIKGNTSGGIINIYFKIDFVCMNEHAYESNERLMNLLPAYIPLSYINDSHTRIISYREISEASKIKDLKLIESNWEDRFGKIPYEVKNLLLCRKIKIFLSHRKCTSIEILDNKLKIKRNGKYIQINGKFPRLEGKGNLNRLNFAIKFIQSL